MLDKVRTYAVLNYDTSPVAISTRTNSELIPAGNDLAPATLPLTIDEIAYINSISKVFKVGRLFFEPEYEAEIYEELRIRDWEDILRNDDIYDVILNPTVEKLERILAIDEPMYFDRIYGAFMGLKNAGINVSSNVEAIMKARYKELSQRKRKTEIQIRPKENAQPVDNAAVVEDLQKQIEEMRQMMAQMVMAQGAAKTEEPTQASTGTKSKTTKGKKTGTAKKTEPDSVSDEAARPRDEVTEET